MELRKCISDKTSFAKRNDLKEKIFITDEQLIDLFQSVVKSESEKWITKKFVTPWAP